jgi:hypothetical protein
MNELLNGLTFLTAVMIAYAAYSTVAYALFPERVAAMRAQADAAPLRAFVIGFNVLFIGLVVLAVLANVAERSPVLWLPALVLLGALLIAASFGLSAYAQKVGEALQPHATPLRQSVAGAVLLYWACLLPGIGWFLLLPYLLCIGVGACLLTALRRKRNF